MKLRTLVLLSAVAGSAAAQNDTIHLTDGSTLTRARITSYTCIKLDYHERGAGESSVPREKVFKIELDQAPVRKLFEDAKKSINDEDFGTAYQRWLKAGEEAEKNSRLATFAQFAYWEAFQLAKKIGTDADRAECLGKLEKTQEGNTAFWPEIWRYRLARARAAAGNERKKLEHYKAQVAAFKTFVIEKGMSERYVIEADLYSIDSRALLRELDAKQLQEQLSRLLPKVEGTYPDLANRVNLEFAYAVLAAEKHEDARKLFSTISKSKVAGAMTKAKALVGRGHTWFRKTPRTADDAKRALLDYMRVAVLYSDVDIEVVGEALYHAERAYRVWNGEDAQANIRRIRSRLKVNYGDSSWAKKR